ncbi:hypothetical protein [Anaeroglobus geminatus]|uniref:Uncharacterized protein n=1 Tax=Anaeroglobus geminatus F0357 TaxID=861450 RepID=G9YK18_9FIRM|nr:hypothetical protein [Anaeroglobus geminatus]EHM37843.1 hypothetical protein HMPREF0080_02027 [Anaeroglobus geminatus F0357]
MKRSVIHLPVPPPWVNSRHEAIQRERELDRRIAYTYATDYGESADIDWPEVIVGAIAAYLTLAAMIIALT